MPTKAFVLLLLGVLALGGGLGGSFVVGLVVGKGQETEAPVVSSLPAPSSATTEPSTAPGADGIFPEDLRQRAQSGELSSEELTSLQEQFRSRFGGAGGPGRFTGSGGVGGRGPALIGTVTAVEANILTLNTAQGDLQVTIGEDVSIRQTVDIPIQDLTGGTRITVMGQRGDDGTIAAGTIQVIPGEEWNSP